MNKIAFFSLILTVLFLAGCKQVNKLLTFNINQAQTITVPKAAILPGLTVTGAPVTVTADTKEEFRKQNTAAELVKDVTLSKIVMNMESPADENFGFLKEVELFLGADNLPEVSVAYLRNVPDNPGRTLELTSTNVKLDKYIKASTFTLRTRGAAKRVVTDDIRVKVNMTFKVTADPL